MNMSTIINGTTTVIKLVGKVGCKMIVGGAITAATVAYIKPYTDKLVDTVRDKFDPEVKLESKRLFRKPKITIVRKSELKDIEGGKN